MNPWTRLIRIPAVNLDTKTASQAAELNKRLEALEAERNAADKLRDDFLDADPADAAEPGLHFTGYREVLDAARMQCLAHEVAFRQDLTAFLDGPRREAMVAAAEQANTAHAVAREHVLKQLADIGFDVERDPWMANLPERHPHVHAAREAARSARAHAADSNLATSNKSALGQVRAEIDQRRAAAVA